MSKYRLRKALPCYDGWCVEKKTLFGWSVGSYDGHYGRMYTTYSEAKRKLETNMRYDSHKDIIVYPPLPDKDPTDD
jgi:hypothetical protein